jgi:hypothetical protein
MNPTAGVMNMLIDINASFRWGLPTARKLHELDDGGKTAANVCT